MGDNTSIRTAWRYAGFMIALGCVLLLMAVAVSAAGAAPPAAPAAPSAPVPSSASVPTLAPGDRDLKLTVDGHARTYRVHVPTKIGSAASAVPLVLMLHGAGGSGAQSEKQTGWDKKADDENFVAVFPDALPSFPNQPASFARNPRFWNDHSGQPGRPHNKIDDVAFLTAVLDDVEKRLPVDKKREFVTGFSSGAGMAFLAAVKLNDRIAAVAPVAGHLAIPEAPLSGRAVPLLLIFGNKDPLNPWNGGVARLPWSAAQQNRPKVMETVAAWAKFTSCPSEPVPISDEHGVKRIAYGPGKNGAEFVFVTVDGAGHTWPGGKEALPASVIGATTNKLNATDAIWTFFARHFDAPRVVAP